MSARDKANNTGPLSGHVEIDETYVGGRIRKFTGYGKGEYLKNKSTLLGIVQRDGALRSRVVPNELRVTLLPIVQENVVKGTVVSTDMHGTYKPLKKLGYKHGRVNHNIDEWVRGIHHTNTIEGFWSHLKRGIKSTHASVSRKHLQKYVDEFAFCYNNRHAPAEMFNRMLSQIAKKDAT